MFEEPRGARQAPRLRLQPYTAIVFSTSALQNSSLLVLVVASSFSHRFRFPKFPWPLVSAILAGVHHLLSFLRIQVCDVPAKSHRLSLDSCIEFQINASPYHHRNRRTDDGDAVP